MSGLRWTLWAPLALFVGFCALVAYQLVRPASHNVESAMIGKPMPDFDLAPANAGRPGLKTADLRDGTPHLVNIFASWCVPCAVEAPQLEALERSGANIFGVALRDRPEDLAAFLAEHGNSFSRIGADDIGQVQLSIGSSGVPETFVVDGKGVIRYQHIGEIRPEHVGLLLDKLREAAR